MKGKETTVPPADYEGTNGMNVLLQRLHKGEETAQGCDRRIFIH